MQFQIQQEVHVKEGMQFHLGGLMNKPEFLVMIRGERVSCLGEQLLLILKILDPYSKNLIWYAADVEINEEKPFRLNLHEFQPKRIGSIKDLENLSKNVDQFLSGVFFGLPNDLGKIWNREFSTEDEPFRDMFEATVEIRAFDTSFFEVFSNEFKMMKDLAKFFDV